jgi:hypothetical protein
LNIVANFSPLLPAWELDSTAGGKTIPPVEGEGTIPSHTSTPFSSSLFHGSRRSVLPLPFRERPLFFFNFFPERLYHHTARNMIADRPTKVPKHTPMTVPSEILLGLDEDTAVADDDAVDDTVVVITMLEPVTIAGADADGTSTVIVL